MAIDLFGDLDLAASPAARIAPGLYPVGLPRLARRFPPAPFIYTGAMENHPEVIARLAGERELWGNSPETVRRVRDPLQVRAALLDAGIPSPRCAVGSRPGEAGCRWLRKPLAGAGGRRIGFAPRRGGPWDAAVYFQEWIEGRSFSAIFVAAGGRALHLGTTVQLVGESEFGARPFAYCGSLGPALLRKKAAERIRRIGDVLAARLHADPGGVRYASPGERVPRPAGADALEGASGGRTTLDGTSFDAPLAAGTYFFIQGARRVGALVVNPEVAESQLDRWPPDELKQRIVSANARAARDRDEWVRLSFSGAARRSLVVPLLVAALLVLGVETVAATTGGRWGRAQQ